MTLFRSHSNINNVHHYKLLLKVSSDWANCKLATINVICQLDLYEGQSISNDNSLIS